MLPDKHAEVGRQQIQECLWPAINTNFTQGLSYLCLKFLQITYCRFSHWIVASTIFSYLKVTVHVSLYDVIIKENKN